MAEKLNPLLLQGLLSTCVGILESWYTIRQSHEWCQYFGATFDNFKDDVFYCHLNEIEPALLGTVKREIQSKDDVDLIDPRTNKLILNVLQDYSDDYLNSNNKNTFDENINKASKSPKICNKSQEILMEVNKLIALQSNQYKRLEAFIIAKYMEKLEAESKMIGSSLNKSYSLQTAIPFSGFNHTISSYNVENIAKSGYAPELVDNFKFNSVLNLNKKLATQQLSIAKKFSELLDEVDVFVPENTLLLLLCSSIDTWEIPFSVKASNTQTGRQILFENSLPLRSQGNFVFMQTLENVIHSCVKQKPSNSYLCLVSGNVKRKENAEELELNAVDLNRKYCVEEFDAYLNRSFSTSYSKDSIDENLMSWKWTMKKENGKARAFDCITETSIPYFKLNRDVPTFLNTSFKLKFISHVAEETMSRDELVREWLKLFFMPKGCIKRVYLDANTLEQVSTQELAISDVEIELQNLYNLKPADLLGSFYSLFEIIIDFPDGDYLLKFNPKYSDKLMVYAETLESDTNKLDLREIYKNIRSEVRAPLISDTPPTCTMRIEDVEPTPRRFSKRKLKPKIKGLDKKSEIQKKAKKRRKITKRKLKTNKLY